jgi:hypothetical protein
VYDVYDVLQDYAGVRGGGSALVQGQRQGLVQGQGQGQGQYQEQEQEPESELTHSLLGSRSQQIPAAPGRRPDASSACRAGARAGTTAAAASVSHGIAGVSELQHHVGHQLGSEPHERYVEQQQWKQQLAADLDARRITMREFATLVGALVRERHVRVCSGQWAVGSVHWCC